MSNGSINLRDPRIVIIVAVLLTVVAVINLRTFLPSRTGPRPVEDWSEAEFVLPGDTAALARLAAAHVTGADGAAVPGNVAAGGLGAGGLRDPFRPGSAPTAAPPAAASRPTVRPQSGAKPELVCTAVLLGGDAPVALIAGTARQIGERVAGHEIVSIGAGGVWLRGPGGDRYLPVGRPAAAPTSYPLVTDRDRGGADGGTAEGSRSPDEH